METIASFLVREMVKAGVTTVYGLPGGENVCVLDEIRKQGVEFILVRNESSAFYMADTAARLTNNMSVVLTTLGPGAANSFAGLANAYLDRSPILMISAQTDQQLIGVHTHQVVNLQACFQPITKYTAQINENSATTTIKKALSILHSGRPGPVHLGISNQVAMLRSPKKHIPETIKTPDSTHCDVTEKINYILNGKEKPVIVIGLGLEPDKPYPALQAFSKKINAPVIDTPKSKGSIPSDHPLFAGTIGLTHHDPVYSILNEADCIIAIGFDVVELVKPWDQTQPLIWISNWKNFDPHIPCEFEFVGNISILLSKLSKSAQSSSLPNWGQTRVKKFIEKMKSTYADNLNQHSNYILPLDLLTAIRENTPDDIIITTDVGSHKIFYALNWQAKKPNSYFVSNGLSVMGFGLASAIAAAQITNQVTICITGDAGFAMVEGELSLVIEQELPLIIIIMNDSSLDLIRNAQIRNNKPVFGTEFSNPDFRLIAEAYKLDYYQVKNQTECNEVIQNTVKAKKPVIIDAMIDPRGYPTYVNN